MKRDNNVYLQDIIEAISRIDDFIMGISIDTFRSDLKTQHAVIRNIEIIGEAVKRLPDEFKEKYPGIPWQPVGDMRNFLIHDYPDVIPDVVWKTVTDDLPLLKKQIQKILQEV